MKIMFAMLILVFLQPLCAIERHPLTVGVVPGYVTLKCDFHLHTVFSDGEVSPAYRVREALFARRVMVWYDDTLAGAREFAEPFFRSCINLRISETEFLLTAIELE